ncbi:MAG: TIM44-like domain-containing protein, partial [Burkholderiaceae bacterium]|nr:TIM44-like domain-containing protein [Burkholderiaceae bacterium]
MKNLFFAAAIVVSSALAVAPSVSDAKRFGGGSSSGMQRSMPNSAPAKPAAPQQAAPAAAPTGAAAPAAANRSWMGPIAGLAAGLGIAALMSHLGLGEAFGNFLMMALLAVVAIVAIRFLMRRFGNQAPQREQLATAGVAPTMPSWNKPAEAPVMARSNAADAATVSADGSTRLAPMPGSTVASVVPSTLPADFDAEGFSRIAKMIFIRMQAANDTGDLNDLRSFTTPEMFAVAKMELQDRAGKAQTTDVVHVDAEVLDLAKEGERQVVSVRFHGQIREDIG